MVVVTGMLFNNEFWVKYGITVVRLGVSRWHRGSRHYERGRDITCI